MSVDGGETSGRRSVGNARGRALGRRGMLGASVGVCAVAVRGSQTGAPVARLAAQAQCECGTEVVQLLGLAFIYECVVCRVVLSGSVVHHSKNDRVQCA